jgi:hypothetical protein
VLLGYGCCELLLEAVCLPPAQQMLMECCLGCSLCGYMSLQDASQHGQEDSRVGLRQL